MSKWGLHDLMVTAAHRYCLGRRTYIVGECISWLLANWDEFHVETKRRIIQETKEALWNDRAGDQCDRDEWQRLIDAITK